MILSIVPVLTDEMLRNAPSNVKYLDYRSFNDIHIHPFIATNKWEHIEVTITNGGIIGGYIKQILTRGNIVVARIPSGTEISFGVVTRLSEVYPRLSDTLRKTYMSKGNVLDVVKEVGAIVE